MWINYASDSVFTVRLKIIPKRFPTSERIFNRRRKCRNPLPRGLKALIESVKCIVKQQQGTLATGGHADVPNYSQCPSPTTKQNSLENDRKSVKVYFYIQIKIEQKSFRLDQ